MKIYKTASYKKIAKKEKEWDPNPWAVCHTTVDKDKNPDKYERCVQDVKKKQKKKKKKKKSSDEWLDVVYSNEDKLVKDSGSDNMKDMRSRRTVDYRSDDIPAEEFQTKLEDELSGEGEKERQRKLDDLWEDKMRRLNDKKRNNKEEPIRAFVIEAKKK